MCQKCVDAMQKHFPEVPGDLMYDFLMEETAFPFACGDAIEKQLAELAETRSSGAP